jgi:zinc-ribbon domain
MRTCSECRHAVEDDFRFCPRCGVALRSKVVEYFNGEDDLGDGGLRVSVYLTQPQHVRMSIWKGDSAQGALSLGAPEADRLVAFLQSMRLTRRRRLTADLRRSVRAIADSVVEAVSPPR